MIGAGVKEGEVEGVGVGVGGVMPCAITDPLSTTHQYSASPWSVSHAGIQVV